MKLTTIVEEDIGLVNPNTLTITNYGIELVLKVGLPEVKIILSELVIYLTTLLKSNSAYLITRNALQELESKNVGDIHTFIFKGYTL